MSPNFTLPEDMKFGEAQIIAITAYSIMFIIGFVLNTISLYQLLNERLMRRNRTRMSLLLIHLAIADLMVSMIRIKLFYLLAKYFQVILLQVPLEIAWCATVSWMADDITCRIMVFNRVVGIYLSGFIMIVISLDRLSAIMFPISHLSNTRRTKVMLVMAWTMAPLCALPQSFVFKLKSHPHHLDYQQCTTIGFWQSDTTVCNILQ